MITHASGVSYPLTLTSPDSVLPAHEQRGYGGRDKIIPKLSNMDFHSQSILCHNYSWLFNLRITKFNTDFQHGIPFSGETNLITLNNLIHGRVSNSFLRKYLFWI